MVLCLREKKIKKIKTMELKYKADLNQPNLKHAIKGFTQYKVLASSSENENIHFETAVKLSK